MSTTEQNRTQRSLPVLGGILPLDRSLIPTDIIAGITLAALAIPEVMGYTKIAGMPVVTGLYTILIPMALFAIFGSSRHLVVGADSATAAIMAAGLTGLAMTASPQYVAYAGILALMAAGLLILARVIRLGFIADFLSRTVLIGFLTGVGIQVAVGQLAGMLGIPGGGKGPLQNILNDLRQVGQINPATLVISVAVIMIIVGCRAINRKIPGALIAVIGSILVSYLFKISDMGVKILGAVPGGLPRFGLPKGVSVDVNTIEQLLPIAISMFIVILAQSAATSRAYATRYSESFSENIDLIGLGIANIGAGLTGAFVVNGSPTKTQMVDSAGGRSQLATLTTSILVLLVLLFLTGPLAFMPEAVLASVVFLIGIELIDLKGMRRILIERPFEFWVAVITALVVVFIGVEQGILLAIILSILIHTRHGYKPKNGLLELDEAGNRHEIPVPTHAQFMPGLMIYRFHHSMYYANAELYTQEVLELVSSAEPPLSWFCIDLTSVDDIDFTAAATLRESYKIMQSKGVRMVLAKLSDDVRRELDRSDVTKLVGEDYYFETLADVESAYQAISKSTDSS